MRRFVALLIVVGVWCGSYSVLALSQDKHTGLRLTATANKAVYFVGEPVILTVTVVNTSQEPITLLQPLGLEAGTLRVMYSKAARSAVRFVNSGVMIAAVENRDYAPIRLASGESISKEEVVLYGMDPQEVILGEAGEYSLDVSYRFVPGPGIEPIRLSDVVRARVKKPGTRDEREAFSRWNDAELRDFVQGNSRYRSADWYQSGAMKAVAFLKNYPFSPYTPIAKKCVLEYLDNGGAVTADEKALVDELRRELKEGGSEE